MSFTAKTQSSNFNRPADANSYDIGDLVANSTTPASVTPLSWTGPSSTGGSYIIRKGRLKKSDPSALVGASFRLHLYNALPTPVNGDNVGFLTDNPGYLDYIDFDMTGAMSSSMAVVFSDGVQVPGVPSVGSEILDEMATGNQLIYGLLEARAAYEPVASETFTCVLEIIQN